jgi:DNA repair protein RecO (recombination protein O)
MLYKTRGIVLNSVKYSETSLIIKIYTEEFGLQSYMVRGVRSKSAKIKPALLQNLSLVDLEVYHKEKKSIQTIKELRPGYTFGSIPFNMKKSAIAVFLNEILYKAILEEEQNIDLFGFIYESVKLLDMEPDANPNFHLLFMVHLTKFLGFFPKNNFSDRNSVFDLQEGLFKKPDLPGELLLEMPGSSYLNNLINTAFDRLPSLQIPSKTRILILENLIKYYALHLPGFGTVKSHIVMKEVLRDSN